MAYTTNNPVYQTKYSKLKNFKDFESDPTSEEESLEKDKRNFLKNDGGKYNLPNLRKKRYNKVTRKLDDVSKDEVKDKINAMKGMVPKKNHKYKLVDDSFNSKNEHYEFLIEKAISMINESEVVYSPKFKKLLKMIDSPISQYLLELENKDLQVLNNYFDLSDNKESISFITDRKAKEILGDKGKEAKYMGNGGFLTHNITENGDIFDLLGYVPKGDTYRPGIGEVGKVVKKVISPRSNRVYVYLKFPNGEGVINEDRLDYSDTTKDVWIKNRQNIRVGRGIKGLLDATKFDHKQSDVEDFVNKYKSAYDRMNDIFSNFELVKGQDIGYWYNYKNYTEGKDRGTLGNSCMAGVNKNYFSIYMDNSDVCSLLILKNESGDKIKGRALVWKLTQPDSSITFMDRIYTHYDSDMQLFRDYAKHMKWHYKYYNDSSNTSRMVDYMGNLVEKGDILVKVKATAHYPPSGKGQYDLYPYVDTVKYYNFSSGYMTTNSDSDKGSSIICLEDTSGGFVGNECDTCDGEGEVDCNRCHGEGRVDCSTCDGEGEVECSKCEGDCKVECNTCDGSGKVDGEDCAECDGSGKVECDKCGGDGRMDCNDCYNGSVDCSYCDGSGRIDCPDCN